MRRVLATILFAFVFAAQSGAADFYASTSGTGTTCSIGSPCGLGYALSNDAGMGSGDTLWIRGGTYNGKFRSDLDGGTVRSYTGEAAIIDGLVTTTLTAAIDSSQTSFTVADGSVFQPQDGFGSYPGIFIDSENIQVYGITGNTITSCLRAAGGSIGGAAAHSNGASVYANGSTVFIEGSNTTYRDFEVRNSMTLRNSAVSPESFRGNGIHIVGDSNKIINLYLHDNESGLFTSNDTANTEVYGVVSVNNGVYNGVNGQGHGMYLENGSGYSRIYENISLNAFNLGTQLYGVTASYVGGDLKGNVFANAGAPLGNFDPLQRNINLLVGTQTVRIPSINIESNYFFQPDDSLGSGISVGYGAGVDAATVINNYFVGGQSGLAVGNTTAATVTGNKVYAGSSFIFYTTAELAAPLTWNNNTYYDGTGRTVYGINAVGIFNFTNWKSQQTDYDTTSTETADPMPDTVIVRANSYQSGRANIIIYAPSDPTSIDVNLSTTGLSHGQTYSIKNAFNFGGSDVASGTYNSASPTISVSMNSAAAIAVATPTGYGYTPPTTAPDFAVLIVIPNNLSVMGSMSGTAKISGGARLQ